MVRSRRINVIYGDNGSGLSRDAMVVRDVLRLAGHRVWLTPRSPRRIPFAFNYAPELARQVVRSTKQGAMRAWARRSPYWDINIFLESLVPDYFDRARVNCLLPNEEWLSDGDRRLLPEIDMVLFKTRHAMRLAWEAKASAFVGFTSLDRRDSGVRPQWDAALHVGGWNPHKGTAAVARAWSRHPHWPRITVVTQLDELSLQGSNIEHLASRISDRRLRHLQNACAVHVCPSEVEGFGHTLMEALSCGAVIVTTDAPPMHELVSSDEGLLVAHASSAPLRAGTRFFVDADRLTDVLARVWRDGANAFQVKREAARAKYERLRAAFHARLASVVQEL
jgi:glycosyltransferase involved in cell wall biosynthesis